MIFVLQDFLTTNADELCVSVGEILQVKPDRHITNNITGKVLDIAIIYVGTRYSHIEKLQEIKINKNINV